MSDVITFLIFFIIIYIFYYNFIVRPEVKGKVKKEAMPSEMQILHKYYGINFDKIGYFRVLRILNFVNALMLSSLLMIVVPVKQLWLKFIILLILIFPSIWFVYYLLAKYLKHLERKSE